jgi:hypothetical protein
MSLVRIRFAFFLAPLAAALAACGQAKTETITAKDVEVTTREALVGHLTQVSDGIGLVGGAPFFNSLDRIMGSVQNHQTLHGLPPEDVARFADEVNARLFDASTIVEETPTRIVYRVSGARRCDRDMKCIRAFDAIEVELAVTSPAAGSLDIAVLVGASALEPFVFHVDPSRVALDVDLAAVKGALEAFAPYVDLDAADIPSTVEGRISIALTKNANLDYSAALSVVESVNVVSTRVDRAFSFSIARRSDPVATARIDGNTHRVYGSLDFGAIDAAAPSRLVLAHLVCGSDPTDCGPFHGTLSAHLAGASASLELRDTLDRLAITNIGVGDETSTIKLDDTNLLTADLNALYDRRFDVELSTFDDFVEAEVTRAFGLDLGIDLGEIVDQVHRVPAWASHDRIGVDLSGSQNPRILLGDGTSHTVQGESVHLLSQVLSGDLRLSSSSLSSPIEVQAGLCLYVDGDAGSAAHPFAALVSASCP